MHRHLCLVPARTHNTNAAAGRVAWQQRGNQHQRMVSSGLRPVLTFARTRVQTRRSHACAPSGVDKPPKKMSEGCRKGAASLRACVHTMPAQPKDMPACSVVLSAEQLAVGWLQTAQMAHLSCLPCLPAPFHSMPTPCRDVQTGTELTGYKANACPRNGMCLLGRDYLLSAQTTKDALQFYTWHKVRVQGVGTKCGRSACWRTGSQIVGTLCAVPFGA